MNLAIALPAALAISLITLFLTHPFINLPNLLSRALSECGHVVLVTAPRHGSTWLIDSVEGCPSRETARGNYQELIKTTELWSMHKGPVYNITPSEAAHYVARNLSVKVFPGPFARNKLRITEFFQVIKDLDLPVFVLNRRPEDSYGSLQDVKNSHSWATNSMNEYKERTIEPDDRFEKYRSGMDRYFRNVQSVMKDIGLDWDRLDYEDVRGMPEIVGHRNRCIIKNCNFM